MDIRAIKCFMCGYTIYSRAPHDFITCPCGNIFMDGGQEGFYRSGSVFNDTSVDITLNLSVSPDELYNDWNKGINDLGKIKDETFTDENLIVAKAKILLFKGVYDG
jgi:hypothetical protein